MHTYRVPEITIDIPKAILLSYLAEGMIAAKSDGLVERRVKADGAVAAEGRRVQLLCRGVVAELWPPVDEERHRIHR